MAQHVVQQGECLANIADHYGFADWRRIYHHPRNSEFKATRPNPSVIYPGDELFIPDRELVPENCPTDQRHTFVTSRGPTYLNLRVQDPDKQPVADARYCLTLDNGPEFEGRTDGNGWIKQRIPASAEAGTVKIWPNSEDQETVLSWRVRLGHLNPLETVSGIKGRLQNLGYNCGEVNEREDELYQCVVRQFQRDHGLAVDGIVGPQTRAKLNEEHRV
jgi:N-acetylmuramoyl-L-alanine amidase